MMDAAVLSRRFALSRFSASTTELFLTWRRDAFIQDKWLEWLKQLAVYNHFHSSFILLFCKVTACPNCLLVSKLVWNVFVLVVFFLHLLLFPAFASLSFTLICTHLYERLYLNKITYTNIYKLTFYQHFGSTTLPHFLQPIDFLPWRTFLLCWLLILNNTITPIIFVRYWASK